MINSYLFTKSSRGFLGIIGLKVAGYCYKIDLYSGFGGYNGYYGRFIGYYKNGFVENYYLGIGI